MLYNEINTRTVSYSVKRNLTMTQVNSVNEFVGDLVSQYSKYDRLSECYTLALHDLPDFHVHKLAALLMAEDESYASESTGADNQCYKKTLLPTLINYLKNTTDRDEEIEFVHAWREGVANYFSQRMQELLDERCNQRLHNENNDAGFYSHVDRESGELMWSR